MNRWTLWFLRNRIEHHDALKKKEKERKRIRGEGEMGGCGKEWFHQQGNLFFNVILKYSVGNKRTELVEEKKFSLLSFLGSNVNVVQF